MAMLYRGHQWLNTNTGKAAYGIQAKKEGERGWEHLALFAPGKLPTTVLIFSSKRSRDAVLKALKDQVL